MYSCLIFNSLNRFMNSFLVRSSNQEASPSAGKNIGVVLVPCCTWKCVPTAISGGVDISEVPWCHILQ